MKKLENFSLGRKLSPKEQKVVLGGTVLPDHACACSCLDTDGEPSIWIMYIPVYSNCFHVSHSEYCSGSEGYVSCTDAR